MTQLLLNKRAFEDNKHRQCEEAVVPIFIEAPEANTEDLEDEERSSGSFFEKFGKLRDVKDNAKKKTKKKLMFGKLAQGVERKAKVKFPDFSRFSRFYKKIPGFSEAKISSIPPIYKL